MWTKNKNTKADLKCVLAKKKNNKEQKDMDIFAFVLMSYCSLVFLSRFSDAVDNITQSQSLIEGMTLVSKNESFVLGFFSPGNSLTATWEFGTTKTQLQRLFG